MVKATVIGTGVSVGKKNRRGHKRTVRKTAQKPKRVSKKNKFVNELMTEVAGLQPYESRLLDITEISEKRALRFATKRLGSTKTAKSKLKNIDAVKRMLLAQQRRQE